ncbi:DUF3592 domain-containing protein [Streptomyces sp. NBC_01275]|uniref:DUF3592 domain-containing protein n=1 Tax=Streptomyces sp. NBC_01275 TaxID=2903807 RepID=UPI00224F7FEE|nr:DUF3592 domain-containing protein [Streptomyces sp. NBC_01275]MCX4762408.1 DUF3592 domain-containing protein [Streptomyces sp. NBC_01275]
MAVLIYVVPSLVIALVLFGMAWMIRAARRTHQAWNGLTAQARCLRTYTTTSGGGGDSSVTTTLHHVFEFATHDGRTVRFKEDDASSTVLEGDVVTVYYAPDRPEEATAEPPSVGKLVARTGCGLLFLSPFIAACIVAMVQLSSHVGD